MLQLVPKKILQLQDQEDHQVSVQRFQLAKLLQFTEEMLVCAQDGDWELVESMDKSRKVELIECFKTVSSQDDRPLIREALSTLIYLNDQITELVQQAKQNVVNSQQKLKDSKAAVSNYQNY